MGQWLFERALILKIRLKLKYHFVHESQTLFSLPRQTGVQILDDIQMPKRPLVRWSTTSIGISEYEIKE